MSPTGVFLWSAGPVFCLVIFLICIVAIWQRAASIKSAFHGIEHTLKGSEATFAYRGAQGRMFQKSDRREAGDNFAPGRTVFQLTLPKPAVGQLTVLRDIELPQFHLRNLEDVKIGDKEFDDLFVVEANPTTLAGILDVGTRLHFLVLRQALIQRCVISSFSLTVSGPSIVLTVPHSNDGRVVTPALDLLFAVADHFVVEGLPGRAVLLEVSVQSGSGKCLVCGSVLEDPVVRCGSCKTPHHRQCFEYLGRCAVFACTSHEAA